MSKTPNTKDQTPKFFTIGYAWKHRGHVYKARMIWLARTKEEAFGKLRALGREIISMRVLSEIPVEGRAQ